NHDKPGNNDHKNDNSPFENGTEADRQILAGIQSDGGNRSSCETEGKKNDRESADDFESRGREW
ncbi:hypothetical protein, partial [Holdemania sp. 1001095H_141210_F2]